MERYQREYDGRRWSMARAQREREARQLRMETRKFYGISLDYFECKTEAECRDYLVQQRLLGASQLTQTIERETQAMSPRNKRNVLSLMEWIRRTGK